MLNKASTLTAIALGTLLGAGAAFAGNVADTVMVANPYVRAVPPGQPNSAAFMTLHNMGESAHAVVSASSPAARVVELHTHIHKDGMMMMRQIPRIELPAAAETELKPGGLHIMLIGLKQAMQPGAMVSLTLNFDDGSSKTVQAPVRDVLGGMKMGTMPMPHDPGKHAMGNMTH